MVTVFIICFLINIIDVFIVVGIIKLKFHFQFRTLKRFNLIGYISKQSSFRYISIWVLYLLLLFIGIVFIVVLYLFSSFYLVTAYISWASAINVTRFCLVSMAIYWIYIFSYHLPRRWLSIENYLLFLVTLSEAVTSH